MRGLTAVPVLLALAACAPVALPAHAPSGAGGETLLLTDPPACVVVLPAEAAPGTAVVSAGQVESALARHLSGKVDRVIGPARRDVLLRRLGVDLGHPGDRRRFADLTGCRHAMAVRSWGGSAWGVVWSETQIGVDLGLLTLAEGRVLWQGRGSARRGDGGLPLSPLSAVVATGLAAHAALDREVVPSVLDDALRSVLRDLPDVRDPQAFASRNSSVSPLSSRK